MYVCVSMNFVGRLFFVYVSVCDICVCKKTDVAHKLVSLRLFSGSARPPNSIYLYSIFYIL